MSKDVKAAAERLLAELAYPIDRRHEGFYAGAYDDVEAVAAYALEAALRQAATDGEWYVDDGYVRSHSRQVALAHCQDEAIAARIVRDHNAARRQAALAAENERLRTIIHDLLPHAENHEDAGPRRSEGWQSESLIQLIERARAALDTAPAVAPGADELERLRAFVHRIAEREVPTEDAGAYLNALRWVAPKLLTAPAVAPRASDAAPSLSCDACGDPITEDYVETLVEGDTGEYHLACTPPGMPMRTVLVAPGAEDAGER